MSVNDSIEKVKAYVMPTYGRDDLVVQKGENRICTGEDGKRYIDFGSGIGTNSLGYCDAEWAQAVCKQVNTMQHTSNYYYTRVQADFAELLCQNTGYAKLFFGNSGAEANECAIKLARKYSFDKYGKGRHKILTMTNSFHGRTLCTLSATGQDSFHNYFFPFVEGFDFVKANDVEDLKAKLDDTVCAVMFEFVQGEGGVIPLTQEFVDAIFTLCGERDVLTIADEVQTGVGRTGKLLAAGHYGKQADVTTLAKGLAGGLPIGVCLAKAPYADVLTRGTHGSTFGGNPIACAGATVVINRVSRPEFLREVTEKGDYIRKRLSAVEEVADISGIGLMLGLTLKSKEPAQVEADCLKSGLLVLTAKTKLRLLPPLNISFDELDQGLTILVKELSK